MAEEALEINTSNEIKLEGLFAFKQGMTTVYNDQGEFVPVTVLKYETWYVSQIKTKDKEGYNALQLSCMFKKLKNSTEPEIGHAKKFGFDTGAKFVKELPFDSKMSVVLGSKLSLESLKKGDIVKVTGTSKGHGFTGAIKRFGLKGGPASHGSKFHRRPGSSGNRTWPGRVMPGKKFPGHWGDATITVKNLRIVDVILDEGVLLVKGAIPGARNSLVKIVKE